ncbi:amine sulfotransferase-like [Glandiceps talaboti]
MSSAQGQGANSNGNESVVDGINFPKFVTEDILRRIERMEIRESDVWLISYPKTGTHWMKGILYQIYNYNTPEGRGDKKAPDLNEYMKFAEFPDFSSGKARLDQIEATPSGEKRLIATHLQPLHMPKQFFKKKPKSIHVMRNPKDTAVSLLHFSTNNKFINPPDSWESHLEAFLQGKVVFGSHADYVTSWWNLRNEIDMLYITYEEMKKDLKSAVMRIATFLEVDLTEEVAAIIAERCTFSSMKAKMGPGRSSIYRKGVAGGWKTNFTVAQSERFDEFFDEKFKDLGFKFEYE